MVFFAYMSEIKAIVFHDDYTIPLLSEVLEIVLDD